MPVVASYSSADLSIRLKIVLIVVPLLIGALIIGGAASLFTARTAVTRVTVELLDFKTAEMEKYVDNQWRLLVENDLTGREAMVQAAQAGIEVFARSIIRNDETELIIAVDDSGSVVLETTPNARELLELDDAERQTLLERATLGSRELLQTPIGGVERMAMGFRFEPFSWYFLVTQNRDAFFSDIDQIQRQTLVLVVAGSVLSILLLFGFVRVLTRPLTRVVSTMRDIISTGDLSGRVPVDYRDEIGEMSQTFNVMVGELERLTDRIKSYAYEAVLAQKREAKVRNIFQKYVPQELIDRFFQNPDSMLVGENRNLSILFSDIRSFTSISEGIPPSELVESLNEYFSVMVDIIMNREGMIDKYIGDAIMAVFGAPVRHDDDVQQSVLAGLEMTEALAEFNERQRSRSRPEFKIGVGINSGEVTVGNIGTEKKMDYTVIGDQVEAHASDRRQDRVLQSPGRRHGGDTGGLGRFVAPTSPSTGRVFASRYENLMSLAQSVAIRPFAAAAASSGWLASLATRISVQELWRQDVSSPAPLIGLDPPGLGYYGTELALAVDYQALSDLEFALSGGGFFPNGLAGIPFLDLGVRVSF